MPVNHILRRKEKMNIPGKIQPLEQIPETGQAPLPGICIGCDE